MKRRAAAIDCQRDTPTSPAPRARRGTAGIVRAMPMGASRTSGGGRVGPQVGRGRRRRRRRARRLPPGGGLPAGAGELAQRGGRVAVDHHLNVVHGRVGAADRIDAARLARQVSGRVPAPDRQIQPAREGDRVVDDDDLLVVGGAERMRIVEVEREAGVCVPGEAIGRQRLAFQREQHREVPGEREHAQLGPAGEDVVQERAARSAAPRPFPG